MDKKRHKWVDIKKNMCRCFLCVPSRLLTGLVMTISLVFMLSVGAPYVLKHNYAYAQPAVAPSMCPPLAGTCGCSFPGITQIAQMAVDQALKMITELVNGQIESFIRGQIDSVIASALGGINIMEGNVSSWWDQLWGNEMKPAFQDMTAQLHTGRIDQTRGMGSFFDGQDLTFTQGELKHEEIEASRNVRPSELVCITATQTGGLSRANTFVRSMRFAMEDEKYNEGVNAAGTPGANGRDAVHNERWNNYVTLFCNENSNKGVTCPGASGIRPDADIKPTATLLTPLTIDMKSDPDRISAETAIDNLAGWDIADPVRPSAVRTTSGQNLILEKRERVAKRSAARSVNTLTAMGWRSRGSDMKVWVDEFNQKAGSNIVVADDPSYHEVMHALTKYKFMSGHYGGEQIQSPINIEREKLISSSLYLMQLRDYFELLERVALTAAVDTSIMLDGYVDVGNAASAEPRRQ